MNRFSTVLIANRGEIACRIISTARQLGYKTIAVYSTDDVSAPHTNMADEAVCIGAGPARDSYLAADKILQVAVEYGAQAIHPGYGFLSENADFADACVAAGLVFIGPSAAAIEIMGNKAMAKRRMLEAGVPCVPGYQGHDQGDEALMREATSIGTPLMVKAAAGGGGRGMRLVEDLELLADAISLARSEALNAFASDELILEKAIIEPRHVEIQIFADSAGHTVHLGERDCSVQRRHQKVIEEAPCPIMTDDLRMAMGDAAVRAATSIDYQGAGTVEFLLDSAGEFYFLEMNTRIQVEHPVTEMITGLDLVALQLRVAEGQELGLQQDDIEINGHAIEVRLYTEDPTQGFLPQAGRVCRWQAPAGPGIRVDSGIVSGQQISPHYDPMVAKIIAHGEDRDTARRRLLRALDDTQLLGLANNKSFLQDCLRNQRFIDGQASTAFIQSEFGDHQLAADQLEFSHAAIAAVLSQQLRFDESHARAVEVSTELQNWSSADALTSSVRYQFDAAEYALQVSAVDNAHSRYQVSGGDELADIELLVFTDYSASFVLDSRRLDVEYCCDGGALFIAFAHATFKFIDQNEMAGMVPDADASGRLRAPMHGLVLDLRVANGDRVTKGQPLMILEAMKMQHQITAPLDGVVDQLFVEQGAQVSTDDRLIDIAEAGSGG